MKKVLTYVLIFFVFGCSEKKKDNGIKENEIQAKSLEDSKIQITQKKSEITILKEGTNIEFIDSTNFKFFELNKFDLREWYYGKRETELKYPAKKEIIKYFQNTNFQEKPIYEKNFRYFSLQKYSDEEKIITIIQGDESCCADLHLLIYDKDNKLLSNNIVAGTGGDGMWSFENYGKFINDSTYVSTRVDVEELESNNGIIELKTDSIITEFRFFKDKKFIKLREETFQKKQTE